MRRKVTRGRAARRAAAQEVEAQPVQMPSGATPKPYLEAHLDYLKSELEKYADKPDVQKRLKERIRVTKMQIKGEL